MIGIRVEGGVCNNVYQCIPVKRREEQCTIDKPIINSLVFVYGDWRIKTYKPYYIGEGGHMYCLKDGFLGSDCKTRTRIYRQDFNCRRNGFTGQASCSLQNCIPKIRCRVDELTNTRALLRISSQKGIFEQGETVTLTCSAGYYINGMRHTDTRTDVICKSRGWNTKVNCVDINECQLTEFKEKRRKKPNYCQSCTNLPGTFRCSCQNGFIPRTDDPEYCRPSMIFFFILNLG